MRSRAVRLPPALGGGGGGGRGGGEERGVMEGTYTLKFPRVLGEEASWREYHGVYTGSDGLHKPQFGS